MGTLPRGAQKKVGSVLVNAPESVRIFNLDFSSNADLDRVIPKSHVPGGVS